MIPSLASSSLPLLRRVADSDCLLPALTDSSASSTDLPTDHSTDHSTDGATAAGSLTIKAVSARTIVRLFESLKTTAPPHGSFEANGSGKATGEAAGAKAKRKAYGGAAMGGESLSTDASTEGSTDDPSRGSPLGLTDVALSSSSVERVATFANAWIDSATDSNVQDLIDIISDARAVAKTKTITTMPDSHPDRNPTAATSASTSALSSAAHAHAHAMLLAGQRLASVAVRGLIASHKHLDHHTVTKRCEVILVMLRAMIDPTPSGQVYPAARARVRARESAPAWSLRTIAARQPHRWQHYHQHHHHHHTITTITTTIPIIVATIVTTTTRSVMVVVIGSRDACTRHAARQ